MFKRFKAALSATPTTVHGVGEGHLPVARPDFQELLAYLDAVRDRIWTAPVIEVAEYLHNKQF